MKIKGIHTPILVVTGEVRSFEIKEGNRLVEIMDNLGSLVLI